MKSGATCHMIGISKVSVRLNRRPIFSVTVRGMSMELSSRRPQLATATRPIGNDVVSEAGLAADAAPLALSTVPAARAVDVDGGRWLVGAGWERE